MIWGYHVWKASLCDGYLNPTKTGSPHGPGTCERQELAGHRPDVMGGCPKVLSSPKALKISEPSGKLT